MNNFSTTIIIAFVIYIAAFTNADGSSKLANYAKIATTSGWTGTPPSGTSAASTSTAGTALTTAGTVASGIGAIAKAIPIIGSFF